MVARALLTMSAEAKRCAMAFKLSPFRTEIVLDEGNFGVGSRQAQKTQAASAAPHATASTLAIFTIRLIF